MAHISFSIPKIEIDIQDSCNCFGCCVKDSTPVYVTHDLRAERFDKKKSRNIAEDQLKTIERVSKIYQDVQIFTGYYTFTLTKENDFLTIADIKAINEHLEMLLEV
jgi:hypothetical protein